MDILSIIGIVLGLIAIIGGAILKGSSAGALVGSAAFVIVVVGTLAASLVQTPMATFLRAWKIVSWVFKPPANNPEGMIEKGLQSLVDGGEPDAIRSSMEIELETMEHFDTQAAKVFESMGVYSPTLGIIGAVMGLMAVMQNLNDPSKLGHGIAAAFIATIYGIAFANLIFLPMGNKLKAVIHGQSQVRTMVIEGLIAIAQGENPRNIESKLQGYFHR